MAALVVQSRFAGLKIEDDDYPPSREDQKVKKTKTTSAKKVEPPKKPKSNNVTNKPQVLNSLKFFDNKNPVRIQYKILINEKYGDYF